MCVVFVLTETRIKNTEGLNEGVTFKQPCILPVRIHYSCLLVVELMVFHDRDFFV